LGGGIALARTGERHGARAGYGASVAAIVQTVAQIGPARVNGPLTQAISAPLMGVMQGRGASRASRLAACLVLRMLHYALLTVIAVTIVVGGIDEYVATYDKVAGWLQILPTGKTAAIAFTIIGSLFYALVFSVLQTLVYERALKRWPAEAELPEAEPHVARNRDAAPPRVWIALLYVVAAWIVLIAALDWVTLAVVGGSLVLLTVGTRARKAGRSTWSIGLILAAVLTFTALFPGIIGAVDFEPAAQRAVRAILLVLTATWARAFAGTDGLREVARRILWRARAIPAAAEAAQITEHLESDTMLRPAATALIARLKTVELTPGPVADALTAWVAAEAAGYQRPGERGPVPA
ncbi:MAG: hypothetical protein QOF76_5260, partial [Solirubrobacteraceae bacterium]|nr:hypothetical protein [Solirubrobacteraceae bacterium]